MPDLAVLIPFASTDPIRLANLATIRRWYLERFPDADLVIAGDGGNRAGWCKARAVENAMASTDAATLIVADSDCLCDGVLPAVAAVRSGAHRWAFPHNEIRRLNPAASAEVRNGAAPTLDMPLEFKAYPAVAGGGICIVTRDAYDVAPIDQRFVVTHGEDVAWARALGYLCGRPWHQIRGGTPLYHLHHPPILATGARYRHNEKVAEEYRAATSRTIADVIARGRAHVDLPPVEPFPTVATVAVIVPVLNRPAAAAPFMASWEASGPAGSVVYAVTDPEDTATRQAWFEAGAVVLTSDRGSTFAEKANYGLEATLEPWLLLVGDDVQFHPGWLPAILAAGELGPVVSTNDLARPDLDTLAIHPAFSRDYLLQRGASFDGPGLIAHEGYRHWYVDREWSFLALERGALVYAPDARIEHRHPIYGTAPMDATYALGQAAATADSRLWDRRHREYVARIRRTEDA